MSLKSRPINLNFFTIHFPITAWVSILHRLSGLFVFLLIPLFLWMLQESLASLERYQAFVSIFKSPLLKGILWLLLAALLYHLIAGVRHLLMDLHIGESKIGGQVSAWVVMFISAIGFVGLGIWLW